MDETEEEKRKNSRLVTTVIGSLIAMAVFSMVRDFPVATAPGASEEIRAYEAKIREFQDAEDRLIDLEGEYLSKEGEQTLAALRAEVARLKAAIPSSPLKKAAALRSHHSRESGNPFSPGLVSPAGSPLSRG